MLGGGCAGRTGRDTFFYGRPDGFVFCEACAPPLATAEDMASRIRVLATGGIPPSTLNGETLYAGKTNIIGSKGKRSMDQGFLYQARKLQKELDDRFGGDLKKMEARYGFNPIFVQVSLATLQKHARSRLSEC